MTLELESRTVTDEWLQCVLPTGEEGLTVIVLIIIELTWLLSVME